MGISRKVRKFVEKLTGSLEEQLRKLMAFRDGLEDVDLETEKFIQDEIDRLQEKESDDS
jgi:hypothetical protein